MTNINYIQSQVNTSPKNIEATLKLLSEDCTVPFISRYRKDTTGNLDEVQIENIAKLSKQYDEIVKRKDSILKTIDEQGNLTPELKSKIEKSFDECSGDSTKIIIPKNETLLYINTANIPLGNINSLAIKKNKIWPKEKINFLFNNTEYTLRAEGEVLSSEQVTSEEGKSELYQNVKNS